MELRQLRYFLKAGELLNFTEAARAVNISQSTLSQQIKQLEEELGTLLFDRIGKRVVLTEAGQHFTTYARQTVASANSGLQILRDLADVKKGELLIGVTYALRTLLTPALIAFSATYPDIYINVLFATSEELMEKLHQGVLDFLLTFQEAEWKAPLVGEPLFESRMALVVADSSPLSQNDRITLAELSNLPLALPVKGFSTRQFIDHAFAQGGLHPDVRIEINDVPTLFDLVRTGHWHTILSMATVAGQAGLKAIPLEGESMNRQASVVWLESSYRKKAAIRFCELLLP